MRIWIAIVCCLALAVLVAIVPRDDLLAYPDSLLSVYAIVLAAVLLDSHHIALNEYAAGLGTDSWIFWLVMMLWPLAGVPWYLTIRERIRSGRTPRRRFAGVEYANQVV